MITEKKPLYLCDPRKNARCHGTVCFYGDGRYPYCFTTDDPACAITGPAGGPLEARIEYGQQGEIYNMAIGVKEGSEQDAQVADAAGPTGDI